jgi:hypothetical protein
MPTRRFQPLKSKDSRADQAYSEISQVIDALAPLEQYPLRIDARINPAAGQFMRIAPRSTGMEVVLPSPAPGNFGQSITLFVTGSKGPLRIRPTTGLINGAADYILPGDVSVLVVLVSDGNTGWADTTLRVGADVIITGGRIVLTGALVFYPIEQLVAGVGPHDVVLNADTQRLTFTDNGTVQLNSVSGGGEEGRVVEVMYVGTGTLRVTQAAPGPSGNESRLFLPLQRTTTYAERQSFTIIGAAASAGWRVHNSPQGHGFLQIENRTTATLPSVPTGCVFLYARDGADFQTPFWAESSGRPYQNPMIRCRSFQEAWDEFTTMGPFIITDTPTLISATAMPVNTDGLIFTGEGSWRCTVNSPGAGTGTLAHVDGANNHPGILQLAVSAIDNTSIAIRKGGPAGGNAPTLANECEVCEWIFRLPSVANVSFFCGVADDQVISGAAGESANDAIGFFYDNDVAAPVTGNIFGYAVLAGVPTTVDLGVLPTNGNWSVYTFVQTTAGTVEFYIDDALLGTITTGVPTTQAMGPVLAMATRTTTAKTIDVDYHYFRSADMGDRDA